MIVSSSLSDIFKVLILSYSWYHTLTKVALMPVGRGNARPSLVLFSMLCACPAVCVPPTLSAADLSDTSFVHCYHLVRPGVGEKLPCARSSCLLEIRGAREIAAPYHHFIWWATVPVDVFRNGPLRAGLWKAITTQYQWCSDFPTHVFCNKASRVLGYLSVTQEKRNWRH